MTNHIHLIIAAGGNISLSDIIRDFKKFTSRRCLAIMRQEPESRREWMMHRFRFNARLHSRDSQHQLWQPGNHAVLIRSRYFFEQKSNYIHLNPVRAGWVDVPEDYVYSSAYEWSGRGDKILITPWL